MGYFRLFYYISYVINTILRLFKRHKGFLIAFIFAMIFAAYICYPNKSNAAEWSSSDSTNLYSCRTYLSTISNRLSYTNDYLNTGFINVLQKLNDIQSYLQTQNQNDLEVKALLQQTVQLQQEILQALLGEQGGTTTLNYTLRSGIYMYHNGSTGATYLQNSIQSGCYFVDCSQFVEGVPVTVTISLPNFNTNTTDSSGKRIWVRTGYATVISDTSVIGEYYEQYRDNISASAPFTYSYTFTPTRTTSGNYYVMNITLPYDSNNIYSSLSSGYTIRFSQTTEGSSGLIAGVDNINSGINNTNNKIDETNQFLNNDTVEDTTMDISSEGLIAQDSEGIDNFFTNFLSNIQTTFSNIDNSVETISFPIPFTQQSVSIRSDLVSRYIINTPIYTLIQAFWWFLIGSYIVLYCKRMLDWLSTGELAEKGPSAFIKYLDKNNELIKTYMM